MKDVSEILKSLDVITDCEPSSGDVSLAVQEIRTWIVNAQERNDTLAAAIADMHAPKDDRVIVRLAVGCPNGLWKEEDVTCPAYDYDEEFGNEAFWVNCLRLQNCLDPAVPVTFVHVLGSSEIESENNG